MKPFKPREREHDADGLCITHGQTVMMEPCYKCVREDWDDLMAERNRFAEMLDLAQRTEEAIRMDERQRVLDAAERFRCMGFGIQVITLSELRRAVSSLGHPMAPERPTCTHGWTRTAPPCPFCAMDDLPDTVLHDAPNVRPFGTKPTKDEK